MYRYTFFFTNGTQGWSETFFRSSLFGAGEASLMVQYQNRRLELLATTCAMVSIRASNLDNKRDITIYQLPTGGRGGTWVYGGGGSGGDPGLPTETEDSFTALLLRLTDGNQNYRTFPMVGFPDHIFQGGVVVPSENALVTGRLNNWMSAITQASFGMKAQGVPTATGRIVEFPAKTTDNHLVCLGITGTPPAVGSLVTLGGVKPWNKLNRTWRVAEVVPAAGALPAYIFLAATRYLDSYGEVEGGTWKTASYAVQVLNNYTISRLTSRKTGVPFTTVRGRR